MAGKKPSKGTPADMRLKSNKAKKKKTPKVTGKNYNPNSPTQY